MLSEKVKQALKKNWGEQADSMNCFAEVKLCFTELFWECYIYALNPQDEDTILCITKSPTYVAIEECSLEELFSLYDLKGEPIRIDREYRKMRASDLYKKISEGYDT